MLKKDKPMLSVDAIIQSQGSKIGWDRPFSGNPFHTPIAISDSFGAKGSMYADWIVQLSGSEKLILKKSLDQNFAWVPSWDILP